VPDKKKKPSPDGPFQQLKNLVDQAGLHLKPEDTTVSIKAQNVQKREVIPEEPPVESDEELFEAAMNSIEKVSWKQDLHTSDTIPSIFSADKDAEDRRLMQEAMSEDILLAIPDHPEYIEGWIGVAGRQYLPNLRNGLYSIQGQIDLHGMNRMEAQTAVEEYIAHMSRFRPCCIKIIHGRGINSPMDRTTLKDNLQRLLTTRRMSRYVLAYASAAARDGGVGAVYVLLSRQ
jgi:DNA-nicking Smr family endonuclease